MSMKKNSKIVSLTVLLLVGATSSIGQQASNAKSVDALPLPSSKSKQLLGGELDQSMDRAKRRLSEEVQSYSGYLADRISLEKELKQAAATELRAYELQLIEIEGGKAQAVLEKQGSSLLNALQDFIKEQQSAANADILSYESARRKQAFQLIAEREASIREQIQILQGASDKTVEDQTSKLLKSRAAVLQINLSKRLSDFDRDYQAGNYVARGKQDQVRNELQANKGDATVASVSTVSPSLEWEVTTADPTLRSLLMRWADRAKWTLVWNSDIDLAINADVVFKSSLPKAIESVMDTLVSEKDRLSINLYEKNKVINVKRRY